MAQDFPNNPTLGQVFGSYVWNGTAWTGIGSANNLGVQVGGILAREVYDYHPNYVLNGGFDIWQRGTSFSNPSSYTADRWIAFTAGTASRSTDVPNTSFKYSMALSHTSASYNIIQQRIESSNSIALGKEVTLSFWAKGTSGTNNLQIALYYANTVDVHSAQTFISQSGITTSALSTSWTRYSRTITLPDAAVTNGWEFRLFRDDSSVNGWLVTGVQLEAGAVATPFRRNANSIQGELAACQRYFYEPHGGDFTSPGSWGDPVMASASNFAVATISFPTQMRVAPTLTIASGSDQFRLGYPNTHTINSISTADVTPRQWIGYINTSGLNVGWSYRFYFQADRTVPQMTFSAEL